jgi:hypothetical protein
MIMPHPISDYLEKYAPARRPLVAGELAGIDQVVAMPVLAEKDHLFVTLADLARNPEAEIRRTLVICAVNNRGPHLAAAGIRENNRQTLLALHALVRGGPPPDGFVSDASLAANFAEVLHSGLRVAYLDASSPGNEMPDKGGGVGMARKIAMDEALRVFEYANPAVKIVCCLDADTRVERNYLSAVRDSFEREGMKAAVVAYAHPEHSDYLHTVAIRSYEILLRYYVLGLRYAGSPYAFHTVGSTMACTADAYAVVRGMNTREAAEDFYFLTKLAKVCTIGRITATEIHPSARLSARVPFGTGRQMIRFLEEGRREYLLYDPRVFGVLKQWLAAVHAHPDRDGRALQAAAEEIDAFLGAFLRTKRFDETWDKIRSNCRDGAGLKRQFSSWFDGFKTLKLIHHLTEGGYPRVPMFAAVEGLIAMMQKEVRSPTAPRFGNQHRSR